MGLRLICFFLFFSQLQFLLAQEGTVHWEEENSVEPELKAQVEKTLNFADSTKPLPLKIAEALKILHQNAFWLAKVEPLAREDSVVVNISPGPQIKTARFHLLFSDTTVPAPPEYSLLSPYLTSHELDNLTRYYLNHYENIGFPFATLNFIDYAVINDTLRGTLRLNPGPEIRFDSVAIKGFDAFSRNVLRYDLGFTKGMPYREKYLSDLQTYIGQVEYLSFSRAPAVGFFKDKTTLFLYLQEEKGNQIDGVIGLNTEPDGETTLNGDFQLRLLNTFKRGEEINLRWRRPDASVQQLQVGFTWPYLWSTPFWLQSNMEIFRQDSSFVNTHFNGLAKYLITRGSFISAGVNYQSSNVLAGEENPDFSNLSSFQSYKYLLGAELYRTNRLVIPTEGYTLSLYGITGNRQAGDIGQEQYGWRLNARYYWNFYRQMVVLMGLNSESLFGANLFQNELFRLGGLKTLRGFNEQSIFASAYGVGTLEYRYMIGAFDYLTLFADGAFVEKRIANQREQNFLTGLGTGINFRTNGGIFSFFIAVGKSNNTQFDFRTTKIHFGYINRF